MDKKEPTVKTKKAASDAVTFKCRNCGQDRPIAEMRTIRRLFPMMVVCRQCEKTMR